MIHLEHALSIELICLENGDLVAADVVAGVDPWRCGVAVHLTRGRALLAAVVGAVLLDGGGVAGEQVVGRLAVGGVVLRCGGDLWRG